MGVTFQKLKFNPIYFRASSSRLAGRIHKAIPGIGKGGKEEGSILGGAGLGRILGSD